MENKRKQNLFFSFIFLFVTFQSFSSLLFFAWRLSHNKTQMLTLFFSFHVPLFHISSKNVSFSFVSFFSILIFFSSCVCVHGSLSSSIIIWLQNKNCCNIIYNETVCMCVCTLEFISSYECLHAWLTLIRDWRYMRM